jgi:hypothetical protein
MTHQYPTNDPYGQYPTNDPYGQYPTNNPYGYPPLPPQKPGLSALAVTLIAVGALAVGCFGGVAVGSATSTTTASGPAETVTARATVTVRATESVTTAPEAVAAAPEAEAPKPTATEPAQAGTIATGTWTVGEDIAPGTYKTAEAVSSSCYWGIVRSGTNGADIIENDNVKGGYPRVTLKVGQDFDNGCGTWVKIG